MKFNPIYDENVVSHDTEDCFIADIKNAKERSSILEYIDAFKAFEKSLDLQYLQDKMTTLTNP